jgi:large subunit ribosomal protein L4
MIINTQKEIEENFLDQLKFLEEKKRKRIGLIHKLYLSQLKNSKKYTASTKTKAEVRGGGKKPWRQKGTGNARAGSSRSPLWKGGGVIFGPRPHTVVKKRNKKELKLGILSAFLLTTKDHFVLKENEMVQINNLQKTKDAEKFFQKYIGKKNEKILVILSSSNFSLWKSTRNISNITLVTWNCLNLSLLIESTKIFYSAETLKLLSSYYAK